MTLFSFRNVPCMSAGNPAKTLDHWFEDKVGMHLIYRNYIWASDYPSQSVPQVLLCAPHPLEFFHLAEWSQRPAGRDQWFAAGFIRMKACQSKESTRIGKKYVRACFQEWDMTHMCSYISYRENVSDMQTPINLNKQHLYLFILIYHPNNKIHNQRFSTHSFKATLGSTSPVVTRPTQEPGLAARLGPWRHPSHSHVTPMCDRGWSSIQ